MGWAVVCASAQEEKAECSRPARVMRMRWHPRHWPGRSPAPDRISLPRFLSPEGSLRRFLIRARPPGRLLAIDRTNLHGPLFLPYLFCRFPSISGNQSIQAGASFREFRPHTLTHWRIWAPRADAALCSLRGHHNPILFYRSINIKKTIWTKYNTDLYKHKLYKKYVKKHFKIYRTKILYKNFSTIYLYKTT